MAGNAKNLTQLLGKNIQQRRKRLGLTQEELAERVRIGQQSLSRMEQGHIAPKTERLQLFADTLGCTVADLFRSEKEQEKELSTKIASALRGLEKNRREMAVDHICSLIKMIRSEK